MSAVLGSLGLSIGGGAALLGVVTLAIGLRRDDPRLLRLGPRFVVGVLGGSVLAVAAMEWALVGRDYSIAYVADNVADATPLLYTITALWGALEGSILLWLLVLAGYLTWMVLRFRGRATDPLVAWATLVGLAVALFFFVLVLFPANPFALVSGAPPDDGLGPNPLLQNHILMAVHPPMLYLGYVGFTVPFAFAVAALATGRFDEGWLAAVRRTTLVAWGFLTAGIVLGAWWSYEVLGWGGYWAWDPVENASLLPWLTGTAFVHSVMVQERRALLRVWNLSLVLATFCLTILGTFITRSGVIDSVHSFTQSPIGPWLLTFLGIVTATSLGLVWWRGDAIRTPGRIDSPVSRESAFLANNLLFTGFAFVVLLGTVFPLVVEAVQGRQVSVGEPYFNRMTLPIGLALLFLMAVAPLVPWRGASARTLRRRLQGPAWVAAAVVAVVVLAGATGVAQVVTFGLGAFAIAGIGWQLAAAVRARRAETGGAPPVVLARVVAGNPRRYGGLLVHVGVVLVAIALASSQGYARSQEVVLAEGASATVEGYTVSYLGARTESLDRKDRLVVDVGLARGGRDLGVYRPAVSTFPNMPGGIGTPSVRTGLREDVYLTIVSSPDDDGVVRIGVGINPMVVWLWIGGGVMAAGTALALVPGRRGARGPRRSVPSARSGDVATAPPETPPRPEVPVR